jgi:hypothetical protein
VSCGMTESYGAGTATTGPTKVRRGKPPLVDGKKRKRRGPGPPSLETEEGFLVDLSQEGNP